MECFVSTNWGGTPVEDWSSPDALAKCNQTVGDAKILGYDSNVEHIGH